MRNAKPLMLPPPLERIRRARLCLGCLAKFDSEWAGERICRRCKSKPTWRGTVVNVSDWRGSRGGRG